MYIKTYGNRIEKEVCLCPAVKYHAVSYKVFDPRGIRQDIQSNIAKGADISTDGFNAMEAKGYLEGKGFNIETKQQEKFELSVTAESIESTDERFTMDNLSLGDNYKPLDVYLKKADGDVVKRSY